MQKINTSKPGSARKLQLSRQTLRHLHAPELQHIRGGDCPPTDKPPQSHPPAAQMLRGFELYHC
jgi:hypothetical protein